MHRTQLGIFLFTPVLGLIGKLNHLMLMWTSYSEVGRGHAQFWPLYKWRSCASLFCLQLHCRSFFLWLSHVIINFS